MKIDIDCHTIDNKQYYLSNLYKSLNLLVGIIIYYKK